MIRMYDDNGNVIDVVKHDRVIYNNAIDDCITKLLSETITCFSDVIAVLEQLKGDCNDD